MTLNTKQQILAEKTELKKTNKETHSKRRNVQQVASVGQSKNPRRAETSRRPPKYLWSTQTTELGD